MHTQLYAVLRLRHDTYSNVPWNQVTDGPTMPLLSYDFYAHREPNCAFLHVLNGLQAV